MRWLGEVVTPVAIVDPSRIAVEGPDEVLGYAELDRLANRFAHAFRASGVARGDRVGVHLPRSGRAIAAMLGALRVGAVYVPLDPGSPPSRTGLVVSDCALRHVVIAPHLLSTWIAAGTARSVEHFFVSADSTSDVGIPAEVHPWSSVLEASDEPLALAPPSEDDLAYILYTSGSTGVPKGVMISHRNALAFVDWAADAIDLDEHDRVASVAPFHFDLSVFDVYATLSRGARLVIVDETTVVSGRRMRERIADRAITVWYSVPSAFLLMLDGGDLEAMGAPSLRAVYFAGEVFPIKHLARTMHAIPRARFWNLFGPTETNVCLAYEVPRGLANDAPSIPIGRAVCGDAITIVDESGRPVPDGEMGELVVEGPTVMLGYWDEGRRTPAKRPYPTGDLVVRRPDGEILYHGRRDHMVKIHGVRIELGEIEAVVLAHASVVECVALAVDQRLVVVVVPTDPELSVLDLKRHCVARLPRTMVPTEVRFVATLPRTSSGKIDRVRTRKSVVEGSTSELTSTPST